jgi:hypothetical protein
MTNPERNPGSRTGVMGWRAQHDADDAAADAELDAIGAAMIEAAR